LTRLGKTSLRALAVLLSTAAALGAGELLFRVAVEAQYRAAAAHREPGDWRALPDGRVFGLEPDHVGEGGFSEDPHRRFRYRTNGLGLRGPEIGPKSAARPRLLVLGDSYVFGWAIGEEATLPAQIERQLESRGIEVETINGGVPGYNTEQEAVELESLLPRIRPDLLVLVFVMNDAETERTLVTPPSVYYRYARSWAWERAKLELRRRWPALDDWLPSRLNLYDFDYPRSFAAGEPKREACRRALARVAADARSARLPLLLLVVPDVSKPLGAGYPFAAIHRTVDGWATELGIEVRDLLPAVSARDAQTLRVPGDGHPDAAAQSLFAAPVVGWAAERLAPRD